jgi:hypothetical protein
VVSVNVIVEPTQTDEAPVITDEALVAVFANNEIAITAKTVFIPNK